ncbi:MAG: ribosome small subunit-dependent GTPase A [Spirochaetales bacterium]|nr:ribosome small subunit-dependent GTPase A [Spirochaetales bacterium]
MSSEMWNFFEKNYKQYIGCGLDAGRVVRDSRNQYMVSLVSMEKIEPQLLQAEVSGSFVYTAVSASDYPVVGDWVLLRQVDAQMAIIEKVLPRSTAFSRAASGEKTQQQIIAANIDIVFIVMGLNGGRNFTVSGLERYLTLAWNSGARPVIVLNKADLCSASDQESIRLSAENSAVGVDIFFVSAATGQGLEALTDLSQSGETIALIGPSGTGKSTIINRLLGQELQQTQAQRSGDLRGRHTTTSKQIFRLGSGVYLIDTPGLKELKLWADEDSLAETFSDITELAQDCHFRDCTHRGEPGCAVQAALATGQLEHRRYNNYLELRDELSQLKQRQETGPELYEREKWKKIAKLQKEFKKNR